ncbi:hypothetical protein OG21DRAFT_1525518, partial [Imleria badia]
MPEYINEEKSHINTPTTLSKIKEQPPTKAFLVHQPKHVLNRNQVPPSSPRPRYYPKHLQGLANGLNAGIYCSKIRPLFPQWKQILKAGVVMVLILEHSFQLHQQDVQWSLLSVDEKYKASGSYDRLEEALKEVFKQYGKASQDQK